MSILKPPTSCWGSPRPAPRGVVFFPLRIRERRNRNFLWKSTEPEMLPTCGYLLFSCLSIWHYYVYAYMHIYICINIYICHMSNITICYHIPAHIPCIYYTSLHDTPYRIYSTYTIYIHHLSYTICRATKTILRRPHTTWILSGLMGNA